MKLILSVICLILASGCGHFSTKGAKDSYSPAVSYEQDGKKFEANVQLPKTFKDKVPLVVIVHEWWGRNEYMTSRSQMLNQEGFATLVVDLYGNNALVETPTEAQALATPFYQQPELGVERLKKYIESAQKDPHVDASKIYVIGYCFGGTQALNYARSGADIKGVVSFHGGLATSMKSKSIKAKILAINGLADPMVSPKERTLFEEEMKLIKADYKVVNYQNATHAFTNPKATEIGKKYNIPIAYNKEADEGSWKDLMSFLRQ